MSRASSGRARAWAVVAGVWLVVVAANAYYIVPASVLPVIMDDLALDPATAGLLVSVMFGTQVVLGVPVGIALDRVDNRRAIVVATVVLVATYAWSHRAAAGGALRPLLVARAIAAPATATVWTAGVTVSGRGFDPERQATVVGAFTSGPPAGFALGLLTGPAIAGRFGWTSILLAYAVPAAAGCALFWTASRRVNLSGGETATPRLGDVTRLLTHRPVWNVAIMAFIGFSLYAFVTSWVPTYLADAFDVSLAEGGLLAALFPAIGIVARGGSGAVSDRLFGRRRRPVALLSFAVSAPAVALVALADTTALVFAALLLAGLFVQLGLGLFYAQARELADPNVAATSVAFTTSTAMLGGFVAPIVGGALIDRGGYGPAFGLAVAVAVLGVAVAWSTPESAESDPD